MRWHARLRRTLFFQLTFLTLAVRARCCGLFCRRTVWRRIELLGLTALFFSVCLDCQPFWTAIAGFAIRLAGRDPAAIQLSERAGRPLRTRTAHRDARVQRGSRRVAAASSDLVFMAQESRHGAFDPSSSPIHRDPDIAAEEEACGMGLSHATRAPAGVFYRRRSDRSDHRRAISPTSSSLGRGLWNAWSSRCGQHHDRFVLVTSRV